MDRLIGSGFIRYNLSKNSFLPTIQTYELQLVSADETPIQLTFDKQIMSGVFYIKTASGETLELGNGHIYGDGQAIRVVNPQNPHLGDLLSNISGYFVELYLRVVNLQISEEAQAKFQEMRTWLKQAAEFYIACDSLKFVVYDEFYDIPLQTIWCKVQGVKMIPPQPARQLYFIQGGIEITFYPIDITTPNPEESFIANKLTLNCNGQDTWLADYEFSQQVSFLWKIHGHYRGKPFFCGVKDDE